MSSFAARLVKTRRLRLRPPHPLWWLAAGVAFWCCVSSVIATIGGVDVYDGFLIAGNAFAVGACWPQLIRPFEWVRFHPVRWVPAWSCWFTAVPLVLVLS